MPFKPCKPNQKRNPMTNRCKKKLSQIPKTQVHSSNNTNFIDDIDSLFGLFNTELISLVDMDEREKSCLLYTSPSPRDS